MDLSTSGPLGQGPAFSQSSKEQSHEPVRGAEVAESGGHSIRDQLIPGGESAPLTPSDSLKIQSEAKEQNNLALLFSNIAKSISNTIKKILSRT